MKTALTPALSHPMGEGESFAASLAKPRAAMVERVQDNSEKHNCCSLSLGERVRVRASGKPFLFTV